MIDNLETCDAQTDVLEEQVEKLRNENNYLLARKRESAEVNI